ncbi:hypothetical protein MXB_4055, partial [Myxobolus squamalis]
MVSKMASSPEKKAAFSSGLLKLKFMHRGSDGVDSLDTRDTVTNDDAWFIPIDKLKLPPIHSKISIVDIESYSDVLDLVNCGWIIRKKVIVEPKLVEPSEILEKLVHLIYIEISRALLHLYMSV